MRRVYRDAHIILISTLLLAAVAFEVSALPGTILESETASRALLMRGMD
jgi:hypothetical protein